MIEGIVVIGRALLATYFMINMAFVSDSDIQCREVADEAEKRSLVSKVEKSYMSMNSLSASFEQKSYYGLMEDVVSNSAGRVSFLKPGKMRWDYMVPEAQTFVSDGKRLWFHQPELNQVTVSKFSSAFQSELPVSFLLGIGKLNDSFSLVEYCEGLKEKQYRLVPKTDDESLSLFTLRVRSKDNLVFGAKIESPGGNNTDIVFSDIALNKEVKDKVFSFKIPKGVDVRELDN